MRKNRLCKKIILISFIFLMCIVNLIYAYEEIQRPLRTIAHASPLPASGSSNHNPHYPFTDIHNSLLTENALNQPLTRHYIEHFSSPRGIANLNAILARGSIYMPFIREEVTRRGLPPELIYLPIIESGFQITARSRSGAMGLWQFMLNSISPYNMRVSDLIDERRDFIKSTKGALQKLEDEHRRLHCWKLTLAAYNSGINAVLRTIQRTGINDYWELSGRRELRPETINFVPRLLAVSYVISQPRRFGINVWHERFEWAAIPLYRQISIDLIADEAGIDRNLMRQLNAELLHGISPLDPGHLLKIPAYRFDTVTSVLERDDLPLIRYHYHIVRRGDTLWSMSRNYGTSVNMIEQHNPGISSRYLRIGETVVIPAFPGVSPPARAAVQGTSGAHTVLRGETFWSIGRRYNVDPTLLAEANGMLLTDILHAGRTLRLPIIE
jgi:membrane-bound lytic murein transglycosylase D